MNKFPFYLLTILLTFILACGALDKLTQFNLDYRTNVSIPSSTIVNLPIDLVAAETTTDSESSFESNNTSKDLVEEIKLTELKATIIAPSTEDFSFMKNAYVYISADGLNEQRIAFVEDIPQSVGNVLEFTEENVDLKEYIIKDSYSVRLSFTTDEVNTQDLEVELYSNFYVDAKILGI